MSTSEDEEVSDSFFYDRRLGRRLESGMVVRLETKDGMKWPLPHPDLLRLHGAVARVVRCAGATRQRRLQFGDEGDEEEEEGEVGNGLISGAGREEAQWMVKGKSEQEIGFTLRRFMEETEGSGDEHVKPITRNALRGQARGRTSGRRPNLGKRTCTTPPANLIVLVHVYSPGPPTH